VHGRAVGCEGAVEKQAVASGVFGRTSRLSPVCVATIGRQESPTKGLGTPVDYYPRG
jgi:hypothetical protein